MRYFRKLSIRFFGVFLMVSVLVFRPVPSHAFAPLILPAIGVGGELAAYIEASIWVHAAVAGAYAWWHNSAGNNKTVDPSGDLRSGSEITWVAWDANGNPVVEQAPATTKVANGDLSTAVAGNPSRYPKLAGATGAAEPPWTGFLDKRVSGVDLTYNDNVGATKTAYLMNQPYTCTATNRTTVSGACSPPVPAGGQGIVNDSAWGVNYSGSCVETSYTCGPKGTPVAQSYSQIAKNLASTHDNVVTPSAPVGVYSDYYGDIDQFLKDQPNVLHYEDGDTTTVGNPPFYPAAAARQSDVDSKVGGWSPPGDNSGNGGNGSGAHGNPNGGNYTGSGGSGSGGNATGTSGTNPNNVPQTVDYSHGSVASNTYDTSDVKAPDKESFSSLLDWIKANSPLVGMAKSFSFGLSGEQSALSMTIHGKQINGDFSQYSSYLTMAGAGLLAISHVVALFIALRRDN